MLLRTHSALVASAGSDQTLSILLNAGSVLVTAETVQAGALAQSISGITAEAAALQLGVFTYILFASLDVTMGEARPRLLSLYPLLARVMSLSLRASADFFSVQDAAGEGAGLLSVVFVTIRLALLATVEPVSSRHDLAGVEWMELLWKRVWPDWFRLISLSLDSSCVNAVRPSRVTPADRQPLQAVAHSVFLDLVMFLCATHSPLLSTHAQSLSYSVQMLVRYVETTSSQGTGKIIKAVGALEAAEQAGEVGQEAWRAVIEGIKGDLSATERLRALRRT
jgi:hypothetical protein